MPLPQSLRARTILQWLLFAGLAAPALPHAAADPAIVTGGFPELAERFIEENCLECHNEKKSKAGFRIDQLGTDFTGAKVAEHWKEVIDRINAGEMPPEDKARPDAKLAADFVG